MDPLPKRKPNRLTGYDYGQAGCYFVTICAKNREPLFWTNRKHKTDASVGAACGRPSINVPGTIPKTKTDILPLSPTGVVVHSTLERLSQIYPMVSADKFVVMPNHIHLLLHIYSGENGRPQAAPTLMQVINQFKGSVTKQIGQPIWQKGYYDHIIRGEADYLRIWNYIDTNPAKWREDCYYCQNEGV